MGRLSDVIRDGDGTLSLTLTNSFSYDATGLLSATKDGCTTWYTNDAAGRRIADLNPNGEPTQFTYNAAGDLTLLTDANGRNTAWLYDVEGQVTNKIDDNSTVVFAYQYDAAGRLTSRWTPAKGATAYAYDAVGNLTNVNYPTTPDLRLAYDALNRPTNLVDAVGQTRYAVPTRSGSLVLEDGPWTDDAVNYSFANRQRIGLTLAGAASASSSAWSYTYDTVGRLTNITAPVGVFGYGYKAELVSQPASLFLPAGLVITNDYDALARVVGRWLKSNAGTVLDSHGLAWSNGTDRISQVARFGRKHLGLHL